jgi:hypothetical protein
MPVYIYKCFLHDCNYEISETLPIHHTPPICGICGNFMQKNYQAMLPAIHDVPVDSVEFDMPGKPFVYHTRGQLKREAKKRGLEVDLGLRSRERNDR